MHREVLRGRHSVALYVSLLVYSSIIRRLAAGSVAEERGAKATNNYVHTPKRTVR